MASKTRLFSAPLLSERVWGQGFRILCGDLLDGAQPTFHGTELYYRFPYLYRMHVHVSGHDRPAAQ